MIVSMGMGNKSRENCNTPNQTEKREREGDKEIDREKGNGIRANLVNHNYSIISQINRTDPMVISSDDNIPVTSSFCNDGHIHWIIGSVEIFSNILVLTCQGITVSQWIWGEDSGGGLEDWDGMNDGGCGAVLGNKWGMERDGKNGMPIHWLNADIIRDFHVIDDSDGK